jgi:hypothetical protein
VSASPFFIEGPAVVSFSGGRTSGYMLRRILDEGLQPDVHVLFADTGKERSETYDFVRECAKRWSVEIHWIRKDPRGSPTPFDRLILEKQFLPNSRMRSCTQEMKILPMRDWMRSRGHADDEWTNVLGLRADEPSRVAKMRGRDSHEQAWDLAFPLAQAGTTRADVKAFWRQQPFDLRLEAWESNCDLCFLKGRKLRARIIRDHPELAGWWIEKERQVGGTFDKANRPDYAAILAGVRRQPDLFEADPDEATPDCICHEGTGTGDETDALSASPALHQARGKR